MPTRRKRNPLPSRPSLEPMELKPRITKRMEKKEPGMIETAIDKVKNVGVGVIKSYLSITDKAADAIKPYADKLPKVPQRSRGRRGR